MALLTALSALLALGAQAPGVAAPNLVVATGSAQRTLTATRAVVTLSAAATGANPADARASASAQLAKAESAVANALGKGVAFAGRNAFVAPNYEEMASFPVGGGGGVAKIRDYQATTSVEVRGVDLARVDAVTKIATEGGASAGVSAYAVADEAAARKAILHEAFLDARAKAQEAAEAAGLKLGAVYLLETGNGATLMPAQEVVSGPPGFPGYRSTPALRVEASATVTARFYLVG